MQKQICREIGTFYSKVQFKTEEEVEKVVAHNFKVLYSPSDLEEWVLSHALYEIVKEGLLNVGDVVHFDYGPKGKSKTHFEGKICSDGIEVDGIIFDRNRKIE